MKKLSIQQLVNAELVSICHDTTYGFDTIEPVDGVTINIIDIDGINQNVNAIEVLNDDDPVCFYSYEGDKLTNELFIDGDINTPFKFIIKIN